MKTFLRFLFITFIFLSGYGPAISQEKFGNTINIGLGIGGYGGYYRNVGHSIPVIHLDYEFEVAKDFTLAPFASFYSYNDRYAQGGGTYYTYRQTVVPIGVKGTYYLDDLLGLNSSWDIYGAGSLGRVITRARWYDNYQGEPNFYRGNALYLNLHLGAEYHITSKIGLYLDLSNGLSTIGLAIH